MSDVMLGKICRKLDVPKPPLGYWRKLETSHKTMVPPLPKAKKDTDNGVWIYPRPETNKPRIKDEKILSEISAEKLPENKITVSDSFHGAHPLVRQTRELLLKGKTDDYGALYSWDRKSYLDLRISKNSLTRALLIMDALLRALEKRGFKAEVPKESGKGTFITKEDITLKIKLGEEFKRFDYEPTAEEKKKGYGYSRYYYVPNGKLIFTIEEYIEAQKAWKDKDHNLLENQLNDIVAGIIKSAELILIKNVERQVEEQRRIKERHRRELEEKRRLEEKARHDELEQQAKSWHKSKILLEYVQACEAELIADKGEILPGSDEDKWLKWAYAQIDRLNPFTNNRINELRNNFISSLLNVKSE